MNDEVDKLQKDFLIHLKIDIKNNLESIYRFGIEGSLFVFDYF